MKLAFQLAYRNLVGAGLRTWLNAGVLSFSFVIILFFNGFIDGWNLQAQRDTVDWEYSQGHLVNDAYDQYDPFTIQDGHGIYSNAAQDSLVPVLIRQASIYPQGRMMPVSMKGITANQSAVKIPTALFEESDEEIPAILGVRMAKAANLEIGDQVLLRWRDGNGTFDAQNMTVVGIFDCNVPTVDNGQIWLPIDKLWEMTGLREHATMYLSTTGQPIETEGWNYLSQSDLLSDLAEMIEMKKGSSSIMYALLLTIALLAIFDTQVLSIFRRQREIGTYVALGMTRRQVVGLFTVEGTMYSFFAMAVGCLYGIPLLLWIGKVGMTIPEASRDMGVSIAERVFPVYGPTLILGTIALMVISATIVSFLPAKKITKMDPVDAIKGKLQ